MLESVVLNDKLFCNGAEQLSTKQWVLYSNFNDYNHSQVVACLKGSGLLCYVKREAFDRDGELLPDCFSIYIPETLNQELASHCFMQLFTLLTRSPMSFSRA